MNWTFTSATLNSHVCTTWHKQQAAPVPDVALQPTCTYVPHRHAHAPGHRKLTAGAASSGSAAPRRSRNAAVARGRPLVLRTLCFIFTCTLGLSIDALRRWPRPWSAGCWAAAAAGGSRTLARKRGCSIARGAVAAGVLQRQRGAPGAGVFAWLLRVNTANRVQVSGIITLQVSGIITLHLC
jgi:hypothetical protein